MKEGQQAKKGVAMVEIACLLTGFNIRQQIIVCKDDSLRPPGCSGCVKIQGRIAIFRLKKHRRRRYEVRVVCHQDHALIAKERLDRPNSLIEELRRNKAGHSRIFDDESKFRGW